MRRILSITLLAALCLGAGEVNATAAEANVTAEASVAKPFLESRDPVYLLELAKYPKFTAEMKLKNGKTLRFASVKSMLNFFYQPWKYPGYGVGPRGKEIGELYVRDYLSGELVPAEKAWYVFGSRLVGPHGDDLIPLGSKTSSSSATAGPR